MNESAQNQNPEADKSYIRSREEVEAMNRNEAILALNKKTMETLESRIMAALGGEEQGARYDEAPIDNALRRVWVERSNTKARELWTIFGAGENDQGDIAYIVGSLDERGILSGKAVAKEQIDEWNKPETIDPSESQTNLGTLAVRLGSVESQTPQVREVEPVDPPVEQLDALPGRFDKLLNPDDNDQDVELAAVRPSEAQDSIDTKYRRLADVKYNQVMDATGDSDKAQAAADRVWNSR